MKKFSFFHEEVPYLCYYPGFLKSKYPAGFDKINKKCMEIKKMLAF